MKKKPYKRKPGDFEIRILKKGRVVMIAADEVLLDIASSIGTKEKSNIERKQNGKRRKTGKQQRKDSSKP